MKKCVSYHMLKILVLPSGAGMESLTSLFSMVILAWSALSWYMLVCISTTDSTNSGTFTPILVTNSTPMEGLNTSSFCSKKTQRMCTRLNGLRGHLLHDDHWCSQHAFTLTVQSCRQKMHIPFLETGGGLPLHQVWRCQTGKMSKASQMLLASWICCPWRCSGQRSHW